MCIRDRKKTDEYVATLEEGLKVDPDNKTMIKNYGLHYLKEMCIRDRERMRKLFPDVLQE